MNKIIEQQYLSTEELAELLRVKKNTIERWRTHRECPFKWIKVCGRVLYPKNEVTSYLDSQKRDSVNPMTKEVSNDR